MRAKGWREPELLELLAADSVTKLYGVVYLPFEIDPNRKYPIISYVYPGPQEDLVPLAFSVDDNDNMMLAQLGFIVVHFSHRGSCPTRGRDYYNYGYGNLRDYALDDDMTVIRQVAARYAFADPDRVGIYGHSGGWLHGCDRDVAASRVLQGRGWRRRATMTTISIFSRGARPITVSGSIRTRRAHPLECKGPDRHRTGVTSPGTSCS